MSETKYTYSVSQDLPNGAVLVNNLQEEISTSLSITIGLSKIIKTGDVLDIYFKDALPTADKTALDGDTANPAGGLLANHDNITIVDAPRPVLVEDVVGGKTAAFDGISLSAAQNEVIHADMQIIETGYLQGAQLNWKNCFIGDHTQLVIVNPYSETAPQSSLTASETVIPVATNKGMFYDPLNTTYGSPLAKMEFYNGGVFQFSIKVASVSGDNVTLASGIPVDVDNTWVVICDINNFYMNGSGFKPIDSGSFKYFQANALTALIPIGIKFRLRLFTNNTDAGTRILSMNFIFRR